MEGDDVQYMSKIFPYFFLIFNLTKEKGKVTTECCCSKKEKTNAKENQRHTISKDLNNCQNEANNDAVKISLPNILTLTSLFTLYFIQFKNGTPFIESWKENVEL